ncbi:condensation domain-containing protein [Myxococcus sp. K15C18031901]|uniref:condensation domain-containing protein n=1 Tax=Myxococcus dinghuensis TaxID=2906761 RepID=UPI0020A74756|nr:condensation domain-containing protein [Myxococcus dinghuensis]MCP3100241.1 condensation domain-containing protein [Myxococcus dinghuensis]
MNSKRDERDVPGEGLTRLTSALSDARMPAHPEAIEEWVVEWLADFWRRPPHAIDARRPLVEQGLDSLGAVALAHDLAQWLGLSLDAAALWHQRTISALARRLAVEGGLLSAAALSREEWSGLPRDGDPPASREQWRLWRAEQRFPGRALHHVHFRLRFDGPLDVEALRRALHEVVRRHEALRTTFDEREGRLVQRVSPSLQPEVPLVDLRPAGSGGAPASEAFRRLDEALARTPFDPRRGPLLRTTLVRVGAQAHVLLVTQHRLVTDDTSRAVFAREVALLYRVFRAGIPPPLAAPGCQPGDVARHQQAWLASEAATLQRAYWRRRLVGARPLTLSSRGGRAAPSPEGGTVGFELPAELVAAARTVATRADATLFVVLSTVFAALLYRRCGQSDLVLGAGVANRERRAVRDVVGLLSNLVALRCDLSGNPSFHELLSRQLVTTLEALGHQRLPFDEVVDGVTGTWAGGAPLVQAACLFERSATPDLSIPGLSCVLETDTPDASLPGAARFDLSLLLREEPGCVRGAFEYASALFGREEVEHLARDFLSLLRELASRPEARVAG